MLIVHLLLKTNMNIQMVNLKKILVTSLVLCVMISQSAIAQSPSVVTLSLDDCLEFAKQNSITLQQSIISIEDREADKLSAQGAFLPSLSASINQSLNANPLSTLDSKAVYSGNYGLDLSLNLYNGGKNRATLSQSEILSDIATLGLFESENVIEVAITEVFVEILYAMEQIKVTEKSLELSEASFNRGKSLYEVGSINQADLAQLESAVASDNYTIISAQSTLSNLYVQLKHLMEISQSVEIEVVSPVIDTERLMSYIPSVDSVYSIAVEERPEIEASSLAIESAKLGETIAKSAYIPSLALTAGIGVNHNSGNSFTFSDQLRENFSTSVGLRLSVPILNNNKTKTAVLKSENNTRSAELSLVDAQKNLYQNIETLHNRATNAQAQYLVAEAKQRAVEKSLELVTKQYDLGMKNIIELLTEQDNFRTSSQEYLVNKYQLVLNKALLEYYQTDIIKL